MIINSIKMRGRIYTQKDKKEVKSLLLNGKSYGEITELLNIPKSTISTWFGKILKKPINKQSRREHFLRIHKLASIALKKKWGEKREEEARLIKIQVKRELKDYPFKNIGFYKAMLAMLYWAEGSKYKGVSGTGFVNTDPDLISLYISLFRKCYNIDEAKFRIKLHIHYYHSVKKVKNFWSKILGIPLYQFGKIYVKKRSKTKRFRKNFSGICFVYYKDSKIRKELLEIGCSLGKIITKYAPIAQRIEHLVADQKVAGSIPAGRTLVLFKKNNWKNVLPVFLTLIMYQKGYWPAAMFAGSCAFNWFQVVPFHCQTPFPVKVA